MSMEFRFESADALTDWLNDAGKEELSGIIRFFL